MFDKIPVHKKDIRKTVKFSKIFVKTAKFFLNRAQEVDKCRQDDQLSGLVVDLGYSW
jgi:hypothetical protein